MFKMGALYKQQFHACKTDITINNRTINMYHSGKCMKSKHRKHKQ